MIGAQLLLLLFVVWSFLSSRWSHAPAFAFYGSIWMAIPLAWALGVARALTGRTARAGALVLTVVGALTAALAVWYFYERNPSRRASYPIGQPLSLAACMIPAILVAASEAIGRFRRILGRIGLLNLLGVLLLCVALAAMTWAFLLTGSPGPLPASESWPAKAWSYLATRSRGPALGLVFGLAAMPFFALRRRGKLVVVAIVLAGVAAGGWYVLPRLLGVEAYARGATARLRLYTWSYALNMVAERPLTGFGQSGYALLADSMAAADLDCDPQVFADTRIAHAHNEWLEIAADLGSVGFAMLAGMYALTFWGGIVALRRLRDPRQRWCLIGLLASLVGLIVEETSDVALRLPGLPAVYYTVVGLTWAITCEALAPAARADGGGNVVGSAGSIRAPVRYLTVAGAACVSLALAAVSYRDWRGARAHAEVHGQIESVQWDGALALGRRAAWARLNPIRRLAANSEYLLARHQAASAFHRSWRNRAGRFIQAGRQDHRLEGLAAEDEAQVRLHAQDGIELAEKLRRWAPGVPGVGVILHDLANMMRELEIARGRTRLLEIYRRRAEAALTDEHLRRRFDEGLAVRLWQLSRYKPLAEQVEILCGPLRFRSVSVRFAAAVRELAKTEGFDKAFAPIVAKAREALAIGEPDDWPDSRSAEKLRLQAMIMFLRRECGGAAAAAGEALDLFARFGNRLRWASLATRVERSRYLFLANPRQPEAAIRQAQRALEDVPTVADADAIAARILDLMALYRLAAGQEGEARDLIHRVNPQSSEQAVTRALGLGYLRLSRMLLQFRPEGGLSPWGDWLERAGQLASDHFDVQMGLAELGLARGSDQQVVNALERASDLTMDQRVIDEFLAFALQKRPESTVLLAYQAARRAASKPATRPATAPAGKLASWPRD